MTQNQHPPPSQLPNQPSHATNDLYIYIYMREFELEEKKREKIKKEVRKKVVDTKMGGGEEERA